MISNPILPKSSSIVMRIATYWKKWESTPPDLPLTSTDYFHVNLRDPAGMLLASGFQMRTKDVMYVANAKVVDYYKLLTAHQQHGKHRLQWGDHGDQRERCDNNCMVTSS